MAGTTSLEARAATRGLQPGRHPRLTPVPPEKADSESRTAALNTVHMSIATTWIPARHGRVRAPIHADTLAAVRSSTCPSSPAPPTRCAATAAAVNAVFAAGHDTSK